MPICHVDRGPAGGIKTQWRGGAEGEEEKGMGGVWVWNICIMYVTIWQDGNHKFIIDACESETETDGGAGLVCADELLIVVSGTKYGIPL